MIDTEREILSHRAVDLGLVANSIAITIKDILYSRMEYVLKIYVDYRPVHVTGGN